MNIKEANELGETSSEGGLFSEDDRVEVLVEDLFIEEYPPVAEAKRGRLARVVRPAKAAFAHRGRSTVIGVLALGAIMLARLFLGGRRRSRMSRMIDKLRWST